MPHKKQSGSGGKSSKPNYLITNNKVYQEPLPKKTSDATPLRSNRTLAIQVTNRSTRQDKDHEDILKVASNTLKDIKIREIVLKRKIKNIGSSSYSTRSAANESSKLDILILKREIVEESLKNYQNNPNTNTRSKLQYAVNINI